MHTTTLKSTWKSGKARTALSTLLLSTTAIAQPTWAQDATNDATVLESIVVEGQSLPAVITTDVNRTDMAPAADIGTFLKNIPGVDGVRMGAHGVDPVIRGQQQDQLNIISDGAFMYGGCPNRMDPPAALTSIDTYDTITVEKGFQSVRHGPGGSGGTVIMERKAPALDDNKPYQVNFGAGGNSNGAAYNTNLDLAYKLGEGYARATGTKSRSLNYEDGAGKSVRSGFKQWSTGLDVGWTPNDMTELSVGVERDRADDVLFAGAGMDSPYSITDVVRLKLDKELEGATVKGLHLNLYDSRVDHLMDNYSLRTKTAASFMRAPSTSNTQGFKVEGDFKVADLPLSLGVDYKNLDRDAVRYAGGTLAALTEQSYLWPGVESREIGAFGEGAIALDDTRSLKLGLRYDNVKVTADKADLKPSALSANSLYKKFYGYGFSTVTENNVSGLARYEQKLDQDTTTYLTVSRSVRTANTNERTIAANGTAGNAWVGNPNISPEKHYQADLGVDTQLNGVGVSASAYYDRVQDFIFRDVARLQTGILQNDKSSIYRNIDATLMGVDLAFNHTLPSKLALAGSLSYTRGTNEETNNPLPQIPPLKLTANVSYPLSDWQLGTRINAASKQTRVDTDNTTGSGRDTTQTAGYVTADLYASRPLYDNFDIGLGVTNVFDKLYASHLNKGNAFDADEVQVNEPGRSFYLRLTGTF